MASRILIVRFGALGDLVLLTVLLRALRQRFPSATIDLVTKGKFASLLRTHPALDFIHALPPSGALTDLASGIRDRGYDVFLDAHVNIRSTRLRRLVPGRWLTLEKDRARRMLATWSTFRAPLEHTVDRYLKMAAPLGVVADGAAADLYVDAASVVDAMRVASGDYVILAPGAQHLTKRWPAEHWRQLAVTLARAGHDVVGLGLSHEASLLPEEFARSAFGYPIGVGVALCERARAVVANDSGLMHVATAVGTPVVAIYGSTTSELGYAPYASRAEIVATDLPCRPCSVFGGPRCPAGHHRCLTTLRVDTVFSALTRLL